MDTIALTDGIRKMCCSDGYVGQMGDAGIGFDGLLPPLQLRGLTVPGTLFANNTPNQFREAGVLQSAWH